MKRSPISGWEWAAVVAITLFAWGVRICLPAETPPGWRDDELINIYTMSFQVLEGRPTIYFTGASGHEPLYHTLHAGVLALVGMNPLGGHLLSIACGVLTVPLAYVLARRMFGRSVALLTALLLVASFWSLMYSRVAIRHILVLPSVLAAFYLLWPQTHNRRLSALIGGCLVAAVLYTYTASRIVPVILVVFGLYLVVFHRQRFSRWWQSLAIALLAALVLTTPLWVAISRGRSEAAAQGIGADARIDELAIPLQEFLDGDPQPLIENARTTLGMFHTSGDPEWLYNLPGRPVFGPVGAVQFFLGLGICLWRWRRRENAFLLIWLTVGLSPAIVTYPPSSLGHTILAQPVTYVIASLPLAAGISLVSRYLSGSRLRWAAPAAGALLVTGLCIPIITRDLRDYFLDWPTREEVRFLYRADYRDAAAYLADVTRTSDVAVTSTLMGPWDRLALLDDAQRDDLQVRTFEPSRALLLPAGSDALILVADYPRLASYAEQLLGEPVASAGERLRAFVVPDGFDILLEQEWVSFDNGLELLNGVVYQRETDGEDWDVEVWLAWRAVRSLDVPPVPIVANPPPPGVYSGPRLSVFAHLIADDGVLLAVDDGLWVDANAVRSGDLFFQAHRFQLPAGASFGGCQLELGLYDPLTGERRMIVGPGGEPAGDLYVLPVSFGVE